MLLTGSVHHMTIVTLEQPGGEDPLQAYSSLACVRWGEVRGGGGTVDIHTSLLCLAEALECWAASARIDAWRLVQKKKRSKLIQAIGLDNDQLRHGSSR